LLYIAGHYAQALPHLTQAQALQLEDYKLSYYLGLCHLRQGARPAARRAFRQAVQLLNPAFDPAIAALRLEEMWRVYQLVSGA
jgi:Flp pilus assembly protein TadD